VQSFIKKKTKQAHLVMDANLMRKKQQPDLTPQQSNHQPLQALPSPPPPKQQK
jgi:hypothetical protein